MIRAIWILLFSAAGCFAASQEETDFVYGQKLYNDGLYDLAARQFALYADSYPSSPRAHEALYLAGECHFRQDRQDEARRSYLKLLIGYPGSVRAPEAQLKMGESFQKQGLLEEAVSAFRRAALDYPSSPAALEARYKCGEALMRLGRWGEAESVLEELRSKPSAEYKSKAGFALASVLRSRGEYEAAITVLKDLVSHPIQKEDAGNALLELGKTYEAMGRWDEAEAQVRQVLKVSVEPNQIQDAWEAVGLNASRQGEYSQALEAFQQAVQKGSKESRVFRRLGAVQMRLGDFAAALSSFKKAAESAADPSAHELILDQARCMRGLGDAKALSLIETLIADPSIDPGIRSTAILLSAGWQAEDGLPATERYRLFLNEFPKHPMEDRVLLAFGRLSMKESLWDQGFSALRRIWDDHPASPLVPDARMTAANILSRLGRNEESGQMARMILTLHPGSRWEDEARVLLRKQANSATGVLSALAALMTPGSGEADNWLNLARIACEQLAMYEQAAVLLRRVLGSDPSLETKRAAEYWMGRSFEGMAESGQAAWLDSAARWYEPVSADSNTEWADDAFFRLILSGRGGEGVTTHERFVKMYPASPLLPALLLDWGVRAIESREVDAANTVLRTLIQNSPESEEAEEGLFRLGQIALLMNRTASADSLFEIYESRYSNGRFLPEVLFRSGVLAASRKEGNAELLLVNLRRRFSYSQWSDSAFRPLGRWFTERDLEKAAALYRRVLECDSISRAAFELGLGEDNRSVRHEVLPLLADVYRRMGEIDKAQRIFLQWGSTSGAESRAGLYQALASMLGERRPERALEYMKMAVREAPSDSLSIGLGKLQFRLQMYDDAAETFGKVLPRANVQDQVSLSYRIILSLLKQDKIPQADVRLQVFSQTYKDSPEYARLMSSLIFERGSSFLRQKEFESALKDFEEVRKRYKDTDVAPEAEMEIGRTYLITNRVEEALNLLTGMPQRYPEHPILARVYLNLGDHYYRSQQFQNSIHAFMTVLERYPDDDVVPSAMRYLIRVYDSVQLYDSALALAREYIRRFPLAEDILQKKVQIGNLYMKLEEYSRAVDHFRKIRWEADAETEAEIQYWIGSCFASMGQFEQAVFEFLKVKYISQPTKLPWATTALYEAGRSYMRLQKYPEARMLFEKIVRQEGVMSDMGRVARQRISDIEQMEAMETE